MVGGRMVKLRSEEENKFVHHITFLKFANISHLWLGMLQSRTGYIWMDGSEPTFRNFAHNDIFNFLEKTLHVVMRSDGEWIHFDPKSKTTQICESNAAELRMFKKLNGEEDQLIINDLQMNTTIKVIDEDLDDFDFDQSKLENYTESVDDFSIFGKIILILFMLFLAFCLCITNYLNCCKLINYRRRVCKYTKRPFLVQELELE